MTSKPLFAVLLCCASTWAQGPVIRTETRTVLVEAVVTGKKSGFIHGLTAKDFHIWQDGKEETITSVSEDPKSSEPHFLVLFVDDTSMAAVDNARARQEISRFIDANAAPNRQMAVVSYGDALRIAQNFTGNAGRLKDALTRVETQASGASGTTFASVQALANLAKSLGVLPGRKTIVFLTGGIPSTSEMKSEIAAVIDASSKSGVAVYPVNVQPIATSVDSPGNTAIRSAETSPNDRPGRGGRFQALNQDPAASTQPLLQSLATGTGGFFIRDSSGLLTGLQQIGAEQTGYYVLSYTPPESKEGSCHTLRVKVDRSGADVRARSAYCATKPLDLIAGTAAATGLEQHAAGADAGNLKASVELPYFYLPTGIARVHLAMELSPAGLKFENINGKLHAEINLLGIAALPGGAPAARFSDVIKLDFDDPAALEKARQTPIHYQKEFKIAPGTYTVSLAFASGGDSFGKIETPLTVEPWSPGQLALSSLVLSRQTHPAADLGLVASLIEDQTPLVAEGTQYVPTGSRQFARGEPGFFYLELYAPDPASITLRVRLLDRNTGEPEWDSGSTKLPMPAGPRKSSIPAGASLRLNSLPAGSYRLEVTASDPSGKQVQRASDFEVR